MAMRTKRRQKQKEYSMLSIAILGAERSGKSCLCCRYINGKYKDKYEKTIEDTYVLEKEVDGLSTRALLTDTCGQEEYIASSKDYILTNSCILVTVACDQRSSLQYADDLIKDIRRYASSGELTFFLPIILVYTKTDIDSKSVTNEDLLQLSAKYDIISIYQTESVNGTGINACFEEALKQARKYYERQCQTKPRSRSFTFTNRASERRNSLRITDKEDGLAKVTREESKLSTSLSNAQSPPTPANTPTGSHISNGTQGDVNNDAEKEKKYNKNHDGRGCCIS